MEPVSMFRVRYSTSARKPRMEASDNSTKIAAASLRRTPAEAKSFSPPLSQPSPPGTRLRKNPRRFQNPPPPCSLSTLAPPVIAFSRSSSSRSLSGLSWVSSRYRPAPRRMAMLAKAKMPHRIARIIGRRPSELYPRHAPQHQRSQDLGADRVDEDHRADGIGPQDLQVIWFQEVEHQAGDNGGQDHHHRREPLLCRMRLQLGGHVQAFAEYQGKVL